MKKANLLAALSGIMLAACASADATTEIQNDLAYCNDKVHRTLSELALREGGIDYAMQPRNIERDSTEWHCRKACAEEWCSGFWPGVLWYDYEATGDTVVRNEAERFTRALKPIIEAPVFDHDLGFLMFCSYGNAYRLTGKEEYRQMILAAADSLATLFNPRVGTLLAWPRNVAMFGGHNTIMDTMMNLEMLFWAAKNGGDPTLRDIAVKHAETTMAHHFRPDHTSYHVAVYDPDSGKHLRCCTHQGYSDDSMWARGQSWAIYGYTVVYRETRDKRFLDFVQKVADAYLDRLPDDMVPYWDFDDPSIPDAPRDASAACVVASALLELSKYVDDTTSQRYNDAAKSMLSSLKSERYRSGDRNAAFLLHSTGHHPAGSEIDASIIYADYYYIEALTRLASMQQQINQVKP